MNPSFESPIALPRKAPKSSPGPPMSADEPRNRQSSTVRAHEDARTLIRLVQCSQCSRPLRLPVTLPCGNSACRNCLPPPQHRSHVTYTAFSDRQSGIACPFAECGRVHAASDCNVNVVLLKVMEAINLQADFERQRSPFPTIRMTEIPQSAPARAGEEYVDPSASRQFSGLGGRLSATLEVAQAGLLKYETDVKYEPSLEVEAEKEKDERFLQQVREACQAEMECHVCYSLMLDPTTTPCGHTFCRKCLARVLDHSRLCPECRRTLFLPSSLSTQPSNAYLVDLLNKLCPEEVAIRAAMVESEEETTGDLDTPLFPCTLAFPGLRTYLHIFEPRYRLMVRRAVESNGQFGMLAYNRYLEPQGELGRVHFMQIGTMLQIERYQILPDGRSFIECRGLHRFRIRSHGMRDGYIVANVEKLEDVSLAEEEQRESEQTNVQPPSSAEDAHARLARLSTTELRDMVANFIAQARQNAARWFSNRLLETYDEPPDDPATLPYWVAAVLPLMDEEKYKMLPLTSIRDRLLLAARWVHGIETQRWSNLERLD